MVTNKCVCYKKILIEIRKAGEKFPAFLLWELCYTMINLIVVEK